MHASQDLRRYFSTIQDALATCAKREFLAYERDFSRRGPLSCGVLLTLLLYMVADAGKRGYRHLLEAFWDEARGFGLNLGRDSAVSAAAFCKARSKVSTELLRVLIDRVRQAFESRFANEARWRGRRVFAVDGCHVNLRRAEELTLEFGVPRGAHCPQVLVSTLFNVFSKLPYDLTVQPNASCERTELCCLAMENLKAGDLVILDRGYPSYDVMSALLGAGVDFLIRVPLSHTFAAVEEFCRIPSVDQVVCIQPSRKSAPPDSGPLHVRAVKIHGRQGRMQVFLTSVSKTDVSREELESLYHKRWEIEEFYKLTKSNYLGQQQFHSMTPQGVRQEILSVCLFVAITRFLMATASAAGDGDDHSFESLSPKTAVLAVAAYLTRLFLGSEDQALESLAALLRRLVRVKDPKRPGRSYPRRSFKPRPRWGPQGRNGG